MSGTIVVNGEERGLNAGTVLDLLRQEQIDVERRGLAVARNGAPDPRDLTYIGRFWREATASGALTFTGGSLRTSWRPRELEAVLWHVVDAAVDLLRSPANTVLLRACEGADCGWLFLDRSRSKRRRWCDPKACGNRAKAARFYAKHGR